MAGDAQHARYGRFEVVARSPAPVGAWLATQLDDPSRPRLVVLVPWVAPGPVALQARLDELRSLEELRHPNLRRVLEVGVSDGEGYVALELRRTMTLAQLVERCGQAGESVPPAVVAGLVHAAAQGLTARHGHAPPLVHGELDLDGLELGLEGVVLINPLGAGAPPADALTGAVRGHVGTLSPEQVRREPLDGRVDQFALAAIAYECLTGLPPFAGRTEEETLQATLFATAAPPSSVGAAVSSAVDEVLARGLAKRPADRFPSIEAFARALVAATGPMHDPAWLEARLGPITDTWEQALRASVASASGPVTLAELLAMPTAPPILPEEGVTGAATPSAMSRGDGLDAERPTAVMSDALRERLLPPEQRTAVMPEALQAALVPSSQPTPAPQLEPGAELEASVPEPGRFDLPASPEAPAPGRFDLEGPAESAPPAPNAAGSALLAPAQPGATSPATSSFDLRSLVDGPLGEEPRTVIDTSHALAPPPPAPVNAPPPHDAPAPRPSRGRVAGLLALVSVALAGAVVWWVFGRTG